MFLPSTPQKLERASRKFHKTLEAVTHATASGAAPAAAEAPPAAAGGRDARESQGSEGNNTTRPGEEEGEEGLSSPEAIVAAAQRRRRPGGGDRPSGTGAARIRESDTGAVSPFVARRTGRFDVAKPAPAPKQRPVASSGGEGAGTGADSMRGTTSDAFASDSDSSEGEKEGAVEGGWVSKGKGHKGARPPRRRGAAAGASPSGRHASPLPPRGRRAAPAAAGAPPPSALKAESAFSTPLPDHRGQSSDHGGPAQPRGSRGSRGGGGGGGEFSPERMTAALQRLGASPLGSRVEDGDERIPDVRAFAERVVREAATSPQRASLPRVAALERARADAPVYGAPEPRLAAQRAPQQSWYAPPTSLAAAAAAPQPLAARQQPQPRAHAAAEPAAAPPLAKVAAKGAPRPSAVVMYDQYGDVIVDVADGEEPGSDDGDRLGFHRHASSEARSCVRAARVLAASRGGRCLCDGLCAPPVTDAGFC